MVIDSLPFLCYDMCVMKKTNLFFENAYYYFYFSFYTEVGFI